MRNIFLLFIIIFTTLSCSKHKTNDIAIIPEPQNLSIGRSTFTLDDDMTIFWDGNDLLKPQALYLSDLIDKSLDFEVKLADGDEKLTSRMIILQLNKIADARGDEGYTLDIGRKSVLITANTTKGIFYGIQTLYQMLISGTIVMENGRRFIILPIVSIEDMPRFKYRGMHLDVCRHMFPVEFIKKYIDLLAFYKFNTFHWHLTEDQGWRIEIKKYPKLNEIGSWRKETLVGHGGKTPFTYDGVPYGGYYTQNEVKEIVAYAQERMITVIPEIEMPGHSLAALASYPELGCTGGPYEVATKWGVFEDIYCTKEETFDFLENVLVEIIELFPSEYIHIGGDEAPKTRWIECVTCQNTINREGLKDEKELQSYFIQRMEKFLNKYDKNIIGWDEILEGGLAPNATVMSWRGTEGGIEAAKMNHDAVMTPGSHCYFDHYQANPKSEPLAIGGYTTLEKVYSYDPIPLDLSEIDSEHILGAQGNVWTEYMISPEHVEYMILPRMAALSEVVWTGNKDWVYFQKRITDHFKIYEILGYNYCNHPYDSIASDKNNNIE
ncbi:MAG: beta-N-acetylhexosaminidase [Lentimicrobiaceae bacterium]|nr:beta-N-acetylhexosaminidase [Lentimicrobiaceae bacterium]MCP4911314.1 beta-N-acetylhexosaminidase [Bacteroidota bacterium]